MQSPNLVIIPTYNEYENIQRIIEAVFALPTAFDILVIDDGSPDGTAEVVAELQTKYPQKLFLEKRSGKLGLGTAYIHGFKWALARSYQYIIEMDADFSHPPASLPQLLAACSEPQVGMSVGSRYIKGGKVKNWPLNRILLSFFASVYVRIVTGLPVKDTTAGFVCYKRSVLENINLDNIAFIGYAFQIEMKYAVWKLGYGLKEIPIVFTDRTEGQSKLSKGIFKEAVLGVLKIRQKNADYYRNAIAVA
ncbi:MAG: polyprenol monophosphomannose synthase [Chitinophagales bacterium]|nr:polyprenol monophosphomannose synthase [Bacteroidota bacterium]MCB9043770.1 polyprenol monophosphomannose synthase [Chitinophagales bacterium]